MEWHFKQAPALDELCPGKRVWSEQVLYGDKMRFRYVCCTKERILEYMLHKEKPSIYEMILIPGELPDSGPCRAYLDCEYEGDGPDPSWLTRRIEVEFAKRLRRAGATCTLQMRTLMACAPGKYSSHIVCYGPWFASVADVGALVRRWVADEAESQSFTVNGVCVIDPRVYTMHRNFRMAGCTKVTSWRPLVAPGWTQEETLRRSLEFMIQDHEPHDDVITVPEMDGSDARLRSSGGTARPRSAGAPAVTIGGSIQDLLVGVVRDITGDNYVAADRRNGPSLKISTRTKLCGIAKREHRGNNIFFRADLRYGSLRQYCYSANCAGKFVEVDIPRNLEEGIKIAQWFVVATQPSIS